MAEREKKRGNRCVGLALATALTACQQKLAVNGVNVAQSVAQIEKGPPAPATAEAPSGSPQAAPPAASPGALSVALGAPKTVFQTREPVTISLSSQTLSPGAALSLVDSSTHQELLKEAVPALGGNTVATSFALTTDPYQLLLTLYPLDQDLAGKLAYGVNTLQLSIDEQAADGSAQAQITLEDFPYFGVGTTSFPAGLQSQGGFQGQVAVFSGAVLSNGVGTLTTGPIGMLND